MRIPAKKVGKTIFDNLGEYKEDETRCFFPKPMWNFETEGITQSMITAWLTCPEKARLSYLQGIEPVKSSTEAMDFGSVVHDCLDVVYTAFRDSANQIEFVDNIQAFHRKVLNNYYDMKNEEIRAEGGDGEKLELPVALAAVTLPMYFENWKEDWTEEWVSLEEVFDFFSDVFEIPFRVRLRGKFDGIRKINGKLWLFETKTKGRIVEQTIEDKLSLDLQVFLYFYAVYMVYGEWPAGVIYNIIRKPQQRRKKDEGVQEFAERVGIEICKDPAHFFVRVVGEVTSAEIKMWLKEFDEILRQIYKWYTGDFHYRNTTSCTGGFEPCRFLALCGGSRHEFYKKRKKLFRELEVMAVPVVQ